MPEDQHETGGEVGLPRANLTGIVLCGGASRRMGAEDKAVLDVGGKPLLDRAVEILQPRTKEVLLACGTEPRYRTRGLRLVLDEGAAGGGPLTGLAAGLAAATTDWVLLLASDMPFAGPAVDGLLAAVQPNDDLIHYVVGGYPEPLCALYHQRVLGPLRAALEAGERRMICFWDGLNVRAIESENQAPFRNLNTPHDLASARSDFA